MNKSVLPVLIILLFLIALIALSAYAADFGLQVTNLSPIDENSHNGTVVGTIIATTPGTFTYEITNGNTSTAFAIDENSGTITVATKEALDYETFQKFKLTIEVTEVSSGTDTDTATIDIDLNNVNEAPIITAPASKTTVENTPIVFSGSGVSISDVDAEENEIEVTLTTTNGSIILSGTENLTIISGTNTYHITGKIDDINAAFNGMQFDPTPGFSGEASIEITADDQGHTGSGEAETDSDTITITVTPGNQPPTAVDDDEYEI